jgi:hypothetical protein
VTVTGYQKDAQVATQNFTYAEDNVLSADLDATMLLATLNSDFKGLTQVNITYTQSDTIDAPPAFIGDNFEYLVYLEDGKHWSS